jgi:hypothetical protein
VFNTTATTINAFGAATTISIGSSSGTTTINGNLTVAGTTTTISSTTIQVNDKNIELGVVTTPTDTTANGGGITLKGATDKTITWSSTSGRWVSNVGFEALSIQNTPIGSTTASTGAFTKVNNLVITDPGASGTTTLTIANGSSLITSGANSLTFTTSAATNATMPAGSFNVGYLEVPQNAQAGAYTLALADSGKHIFHSNATAHTYTIPANGTVAYPVGTVLTFINDTGSGVLTITVTTDTLIWVPSGNTSQSRSLAANGIATYIKVGTTKWFVSGNGLS